MMQVAPPTNNRNDTVTRLYRYFEVNPGIIKGKNAKIVCLSLNSFA